jgi:hypothetical protein
VVIIDKLGSYQKARRRIARSVEHRQPKYLISTGSGRASMAPFRRIPLIPVPNPAPPAVLLAAADSVPVASPPARGVPGRRRWVWG